MYIWDIHTPEYSEPLKHPGFAHYLMTVALKIVLLYFN